MTLTVPVSNVSTPMPTRNPTETATPTTMPSVTTNSPTTPVPTEIPTLPPTSTPTPTETPTVITTPSPVHSFAFDVDVVPTGPKPGDDLIDTLNYCNNGTVAINGVVFQVIVPAYTNFNSSKSDAGWLCLQPYAGNPCQFFGGRVDAKSCGIVKLALTMHNEIPDSAQVVSLTVNAFNSNPLFNLEQSTEVLSSDHNKVLPIYR